MGDGGPPKPGLTDKLQSYAIAGETFTIPEYYGELSGPMGSGAYGVVCAAVNKRTGEKVAVKKIRGAFNNTEDAKRTLREARLLRHFKHDNVISFKDILPPSPDLTFASIYVIMELMDTDLFTIIRSGQTLEDDHILYFMYQILCGVQYIHSFDVVHRDLKPANLLVNKDCCLKICDFGMARGIGPAHHNSKMTEYVVTRWYRAPEVLLRSCGYTKALDVWSVGCIFAELLLRQPLFPGKNHAHQMHIILDVLGAPTEMGWKNVCEGRTWECFKDKPREPKRPLSSFLTKASPTALDLVKKLLSFDPSQRISIAEALQHGYLQDVFRASSDLSQPSGLIPVLAWEDNLFKLSMESPPIQKWRLKELMYNEVRCYHKEMPTWEEAVHQAKETTDVRGAVDLKRSRPSNSSSSAPIPFAPFPDKTAPWAEHQKKVQQQQQFIAQQQQQKQLIAQQLQQNQMQRGGGVQPAPQGGVVQQQLLQGQQQLLQGQQQQQQQQLQQLQQLQQQLQGQYIPPQPQQQPLSGQYPPQAGQIPQQQPRASQQFAAPQPPTAHKQAMLQPSAARPMSNGGFVALAPASNGSSMSLASPATMSTAPSDIASLGSFEFAGSDLELIDKNVSFDALAAFDVSTPLPEGSRDAKKAKLTLE